MGKWTHTKNIDLVFHSPCWTGVGGGGPLNRQPSWPHSWNFLNEVFSHIKKHHLLFARSWGGKQILQKVYTFFCCSSFFYLRGNVRGIFVKEFVFSLKLKKVSEALKLIQKQENCEHLHSVYAIILIVMVRLHP